MIPGAISGLNNHSLGGKNATWLSINWAEFLFKVKLNFHATLRATFWKLFLAQGAKFLLFVFAGAGDEV